MGYRGESQSSGPKVGAKDRVLVVDDNSASRLSLQTLLSDDFEVAVAEDADDAEKILLMGGILVLLSDFEMPGRNGVELMRSAMRRDPGLVCMLLTGHATHREVRAADRDQTIFATILKPYEPADLISIVKRAVGVSKLRAATSARVHVRV